MLLLFPRHYPPPSLNNELLALATYLGSTGSPCGVYICPSGHQHLDHLETIFFFQDRTAFSCICGSDEGRKPILHNPEGRARWVERPPSLNEQLVAPTHVSPDVTHVIRAKPQ